MADPKKVTSGKELLSKKSKKAVAPDGESTEQQLAPGELAEIHTPELSTDTFQIADKTFKIKVSNIKTQKIMAKSLRAVNDLIATIDIIPIVEGFRERSQKTEERNREFLEKVRDLDEDEVEKQFDTLAEGLGKTQEDFYVDIASLVKDVLQYGGVPNILTAIMDLMAGIVFAICSGQDKGISRDWIEENINFNQAQDIFFRQMEKDEVQGRAIDFLALSVRLLTKKAEPISPTS